jgi:hypothetical protein
VVVLEVVVVGRVVVVVVLDVVVVGRRVVDVVAVVVVVLWWPFPLPLPPPLPPPFPSPPPFPLPSPLPSLVVVMVSDAIAQSTPDFASQQLEQSLTVPPAAEHAVASGSS